MNDKQKVILINYFDALGTWIDGGSDMSQNAEELIKLLEESEND